jgi:alanine-glyoxylate transaminase/serine-glyoxylate transaminase/serine-pyruvate transaminase
MRRPERLLLGPGPSNAPPEVLAALGRPLLGHLDPEFLEMLDDTAERLRLVFRTSNRLTFAVSGTGSAGMEAAFVNLLEPDDVAVIGVNGVFGGRMADVAARCGAQVVTVEAPWGEPVPPADLAAALDAHPQAKLVAVVQAETSTGCAQPMDQTAAVVRDHPALFVVDAVTALGGAPVEVDSWGVDVCYAGTQKCLSVPPGLAPITFSERALDAVRARRTPVQSWYLDVTMLERYWGSDRVYHHTAPVGMVAALHAGLGVVLREGLPARWERHERLGADLAKGLEARGFSYVPPDGHRLPMLHCVRLPGELEEGPLRRRLLDTYGIEIGGGLGPLAGTCWRFGLMGHSCTQRNVLTVLAALDEVLRA